MRSRSSALIASYQSWVHRPVAGSIAGNAATVTTNANLTGPITSVGNATSIASQTGTGTKFVVDTSPTLVTPVLGVASATSINFGGTALSVYAENTFVPTLTFTTGSATLTSATGEYTKTGRAVFFEINIVVNAVSSPTGVVTVGNLPFTSGATNAVPVSVWVNGMNATWTGQAMGQVGGGATSATISEFAAGAQSNPGAKVSNGATIRVSGTYNT